MSANKTAAAMFCHVTGAGHQQQPQLSKVCNILLLLLTLHSSAAATAMATSMTDAASARTSFTRVKHFTMVLPLAPLKKPPTPPPAYKDKPMDDWEWLGGTGYLLITRSDYNMVGALAEAFYIPGRFRPKCSKKQNEAFYSAQRLWVNMEISRDIGRQVWGFPKDMASLVFGPRSITVTDEAGNSVLQATFSGPLPTAPSKWLQTLATEGLPTIQWPLQEKVNIARILLLKSPAAIFDTGADDLTPNTQHLALNGTAPGAVIPAPAYKQLHMMRAVKVKFNSQLFTGQKKQTVRLAYGDKVGFIEGTPGSLSNPTKYQC